MFERTRAAVKVLFGNRQPGDRVITAAYPSEAGVHVSEDAAMRFATVHACVRVISEDVGALPLHLYRRLKDGGKERATDHPLYALLHDRPNPEMTSVSFREAMMVNALLTGNGYAFIEYERSGRIKALWPMLSSEVQPYRTDAGELRYRAAGMDLRASEVFHLPGLGYDGLVGMSPIAYARESIGLGIAAERYGEKFFRNGTHVGGVVSVKDELSDDQFERLKNQFSGMFRGLQNAHGVPVLEGGATYTQLGIPPEDAQFLETRKYQRSEIAAIYRVPPHMIGDLERATFSNIEQQDLAYLQRSLMPWLVRIEQQGNAKLLADKDRALYSMEHDTAGFMRGETATRMQAYSTAIMAGIMTPNEARRRENLNPLPGGDDILLPLNMVQAGEREHEAVDEMQQRAQRFRHFIPGGERRTVSGSNIAAQLEWLGIPRKVYEGLAQDFSAWLERQADDIQRIVDDETDKRSLRRYKSGEEELPRRIISRLGSYYRRLMDPDDEYGLEQAINNNEYPEWASLNDALADIAQGAWRLVAADIGDEAPNENWCKGYLDKYRQNMTDRLCRANYDELVRALKKAGISDENNGINKMISTMLHGWRRGEYRTCSRGVNMARTEAAFMRNEAMIAAYRYAGYSSVWQSAPGCCKICTAMNGQTITTLKPPMHKGCGCGVIRGGRLEMMDVYEKLRGNRLKQLKEHPELKLPNADKAIAASEKFTKYLFNKENADGWAKGIAISERLGYNKDNYEEFRKEILENSRVYPSTLKGEAAKAGVVFGYRYEQRMILFGLNGTPANVYVAWLVNGKETRLVTAYLKEVREDEKD